MPSEDLGFVEHYLELSERVESVLSALDLSTLEAASGVTVFKGEQRREIAGQERRALKDKLAHLTKRAGRGGERPALTDYLSKVDLDLSKIAHDSEGTI